MFNTMLLGLFGRAGRGIFSSKKEEFEQKVEVALKIRALGGHFVQSQGEKIIADRLYSRGVPYIYDSLIEIHGQWVRPDFMLPNHKNLLIEFKGMDNPDYDEKFARKLAILEGAGMQVVVVEPNDMGKISGMII